MEVPSLFRALIDDAGLFPPTSLPPGGALARYRGDKTAGNPTLTGHFLCRAEALGDLLAVLDDDEGLPVGMITDLIPGKVQAGLAALTGRTAYHLAAVEGLPPSADTPAEAVKRAMAALTPVPEEIRCCIEIPLTAGWQTAVDALAGGPYAAKVRCGGLRGDLFPETSELGRFIHHCVRSGVRINPTAGLHHAVRHTDDRTGWPHHGFLNLLLGTCRAVDGATAEQVVAALEARDPQVLVREALALADDLTAAARGALPSYGSCDTHIPLDDLRELGLVTE